MVISEDSGLFQAEGRWNSVSYFLIFDIVAGAQVAWGPLDFIGAQPLCPSSSHFRAIIYLPLVSAIHHPFTYFPFLYNPVDFYFLFLTDYFAQGKLYYIKKENV